MERLSNENCLNWKAAIVSYIIIQPFKTVGTQASSERRPPAQEPAPCLSLPETLVGLNRRCYRGCLLKSLQGHRDGLITQWVCVLLAFCPVWFVLHAWQCEQYWQLFNGFICSRAGCTFGSLVHFVFLNVSSLVWKCWSLWVTFH